MKPELKKIAVVKRWIMMSIAVLVALSFLLFGHCRPGKRQEQSLHTPFEIIDNSGNKREYRVFLPVRAAGESVPLLVYFHGAWSGEFRKRIPALRHYTGSPVEETGLIELSRKKRFVLLVPSAHYEFKSLKNCTARGWKLDEEIDGIEKIIDKIAAAYDIAKDKIYLAGISAGAVLCHHLANKRPYYYAAVLSHSQAYTDKEGKGKVRQPAVRGPQFGVLFAYNIGDYPNLIEYCQRSYNLYRDCGYRTVLLKDLPPRGHAWSVRNNERFWSILDKIRRKPGSPIKKLIF